MALACAGCAATPTGGVASYDALKQAEAACAAKGGKLALARNGDNQQLADWQCRKP